MTTNEFDVANGRVSAAQIHLADGQSFDDKLTIRGTREELLHVMLQLDKGCQDLADGVRDMHAASHQGDFLAGLVGQKLEESFMLLARFNLRLHDRLGIPVEDPEV